MNLSKVREEVFDEVFEEFAYLTIRKFDPKLLAAICNRLADDRGEAVGFGVVLADPRPIHLALATAAIKYIVSGRAEEFYVDDKSGIVSNLTVCRPCQNGEHERCYTDRERFQFCSCVCSKAIKEVRDVGESVGAIRRAWRRVIGES